jgi:hypothetical protein
MRDYPIKYEPIDRVPGADGEHRCVCTVACDESETLSWERWDKLRGEWVALGNDPVSLAKVATAVMASAKPAPVEPVRPPTEEEWVKTQLEHGLDEKRCDGLVVKPCECKNPLCQGWQWVEK